MLAGLSATACHSTKTQSPQPAPAPIAKAQAAPATKPAAKPAPKAMDGMLLSAMALPTGDKGTSVVLLEKFGPAEVKLNQAFEYRLVVTNLTDGDLDQVAISDPFPQGFKIQSTEPAFASSDVQSGNWILGTIPANEKREVVVRGAATSTGVISSCTQISYDSAMCMVTRVVAPGLAITLEAPPEVLICDDIQVTYKVCNPGTGSADQVKITIDYPQGLVDAQGNKKMEKVIASLAPGQCEEFPVLLKASKTGRYTHGGSAKSIEGLESSVTAASTLVRQPKLAISVSGSDSVFVGRLSTCSVQVENTGDAPSEATRLKFRVPDGLQFVKATGGGALVANSTDLVAWDLGAMPAGAKVKFDVDVRALSIGKLNLSARVEGICVPEVVAANALEVNGIPAVLLEVVDENDPVVVGEEEVYVITVSNQGSAADTNLRISCDLPSNVELVSVTGATKGTVVGNRVTFAPLASLAAGKETKWKVTVRGKTAANARFQVTMHTDNLGGVPVQETEATNYYE